uniref:RNA-dependent RNA polymerase n=1 Tax=Soybean thrips mito-like virus 1 TaxID=2805487 RepID=A0A7T8G220_9VIRU|nr:RNA-dependent RNA polymerase [Soybean thrips mito-like virus 1]
MKKNNKRTEPLLSQRLESLQQWKLVTSWFFSSYLPMLDDAQTAINDIAHVWAKYVETKGYLWTVKRFKLFRLIVTRFLCNSPYRPETNIALRKLDGLPKALGPTVIRWVQAGDRNSLQGVLTLLTIGRALTPETYFKPDLEPITKASCAQIGIPTEFMMRFIKDFRIETVSDWTGFHYSTKSGPHGVAMWSALSDLRELPEELRQSISVLGGKPLKAAMDAALAIPEPLFNEFEGRFRIKANQPIRKLSLIEDKEGKCRIIAILDYWSQTALKPLHDSVLDTLRTRFKADRTFNQGSFRFDGSELGPFYSFDLSSATDRFPVSLQKQLVGCLLGSERAVAWEDILTKMEYSPNWQPGSVKYGAGQPMGAYSSWAIFTLSHHLVVQYSAFLVNKYPTTAYRLLGDDIVISDPFVARKYQEIISKLGVDISMDKSHVSETTYEFAKRWIHKGEEITPFPIGALMSSSGQYDLIAEVFMDALRKGLRPRVGQHLIDLSDPGFCASVFACFGKSADHSDRLAYRMRLLLMVPRNHSQAVEKSKDFLSAAGFHVSCHWSNETAARYFERCSALIVAKDLSEEAAKIVKLLQTWFFTTLLKIDESPSDAVSQTLSRLKSLPIPAVQVLNSLENKAFADVFRLSLQKPDDLRTLVYETPTIVFPDVGRIDPRRKSLLTTQAMTKRIKALREMSWKMAQHLASGK